MSYLSEQELSELGLRAVGADVRLHRSVQIFGAEHVSIGSHVRIDCFSVITAGPQPVTLGDHVHLGVGVCMFGTHGIEVGDFVSLSARVAVYSTNDDYTAGSLTGPTVPDEYRSVDAAPVAIEELAVIGAGSVILPGVRLARGAAVGALSLVKRDLAAGEVAAGAPARVIGQRDVERLSGLEERLRAKETER